MKPSRARTWLDEILAGAEPDSTALDRLLAECGPENLHHEYKAGAELASERKGAGTVRQYAAGFANADGGMLLVGVTNEGKVDGCARPGGQPILGRRNHPRLVVPHIRARFWAGHGDDQKLSAPNTPIMRLSLVVEIENDSLVFAEDVRVGMVAWVVSRDRRHAAAQALRARVTVPQKLPPVEFPQNGAWQPAWLLAHVEAYEDESSDERVPAVSLGAFQRSSTIFLQMPLPVPIDVSRSSSVPEHSTADRAAWYRAAFRGDVLLKAALYVLARNSEPSWFQVTVRYNAASQEQSSRSLKGEAVTIESYAHAAPTVAWDFQSGEPPPALPDRAAEPPRSDD